MILKYGERILIDQDLGGGVHMAGWRWRWVTRIGTLSFSNMYMRWWRVLCSKSKRYVCCKSDLAKGKKNIRMRSCENKFEMNEYSKQQRPLFGSCLTPQGGQRTLGDRKITNLAGLYQVNLQRERERELELILKNK